MISFLVLNSSKSKLELEWDCLLSIYSTLGVVGKMFARKRIAEIHQKLNKKGG